APWIRAGPRGHLAARDGHGRAGGRAPGRVTGLARIVHGAGGAGVAPAGKAKVLAVSLADDRATGIEDARDDRGIDVGDVAHERRSAVHHRHTGQADVVLERDRLPGELAARHAFHGRLHVPRVVAVFGALRPVARRAWILHRGHVVRHRGDGVVRREGA